MCTMFEVPCPACGGRLAADAKGDLLCPVCVSTYQLRMGLLVPVDDESAGKPRAARPAGVPTAGQQ